MLWSAFWLFVFDGVSDDVAIPAWVYIFFLTCGIVRLIILNSRLD